MWREWLSNYLFSRYFANHIYYKLNGDSRIDNSEQRMTQDVETFANSSVGLFVSILESAVNIVTFSSVLWGISHRLTYVVVAYSAVGSVIALVIGQRLIGLNFRQTKLEADLRYDLADVRRDAESIALYQGENRERLHASAGLRQAIANLYAMAYVNRNLGFYTTLFNFLVQIIPAVVIAPLYFGGNIDFGEITRAGLAFTLIFTSMTLFVQQFMGISSYFSNINRLGSFIEVMNEFDNAPAQLTKQIELVTADHLALDDVTVLTPDAARTLVAHLSIMIAAGCSVLIMGPSGCGKSTLLRAIAGIARAGCGRIFRPRLADMMFLPQRPYVPESTLREALCYPNTKTCPRDAQLLALLDLVSLPLLALKVGGLDRVYNWRQTLSPGEQQRLSMARVINSKPQYVFLDEATSALDPENERLLYTLLQSVGCTFVSVGHRPALVKHHTHVLELLGNGGWKYYPASEYVEQNK